MAVTRQNLTDRLNRMKNATAASPITPVEFTTFLDDWINYMTKDGAYDAGVLEAWKQQSLNQSSQVSHAPSGQITGTTVKAALEQLDTLNLNLSNSFVRSAFRPALLLDFVNSRFLDPKNIFTRNSIGSYIDEQGQYRLANSNKPRFTHSLDTQSCQGLLIEPSRTNMYPNSEDISIYKSPSTTFDGYTLLDGFRAFKFTLTATSNAFVGKALTLTPNTTYTYSYLCSLANSTIVRLEKTGGIVSRVVSTVSELYAIGVYKHTVTFTTAADEINGMFHVGRLDVNGASFIVAAVQLEVGAFATSYIPTTSTIPVTRAIDRLSIPLSISPTEITLMVEIDVKQAAIEAPFIELRGPDTTGWNSVRLLLSSVLGRYAIAMESAGATQYNIQSLQKASKGILVYRVTNAKQSVYYNGELIITNTATVTLPSNLSNIIVSTATVGTYLLKTLAYWNIAIPESDCLALSSGSDKVTKFDLGRSAFIRPEAILRTLGRQEFTVDGAGAATVSRNIRRPYDCLFEVIDSDGCTITATPSGTITANTNNPLTFTAAVGKSLTYSLTPVFES